MAGIGAILLIFSSIPGAGVILGIAGLILLLIGIKGLSQYYSDMSIYDNALKGIIFFIIGVAAFAVVGFSFFFSVSTISNIGTGSTFLSIFGLIAALVILFIFYVLAAIYLRKAFSSLAQKTGERTFETAGLLLFISAILTIILVGAILLFVAWILAAIAFFSIKTPQTYAQAPQYSAPSQPTQTLYCPNCGAPVQANAAFCPNCGKPLPQ